MKATIQYTGELLGEGCASWLGNELCRADNMNLAHTAGKAYALRVGGLERREPGACRETGGRLARRGARASMAKRPGRLEQRRRRSASANLLRPNGAVLRACPPDSRGLGQQVMVLRAIRSRTRHPAAAAVLRRLVLNPC